ncbi:phenylacetaldoxime dehydratase family protein [Pseudomonas corrugata]|uniref:phenylacetaldoxime dehydratase family protein n=1 Tax=Pseudomonas corrugata TaxID=47879 RepID=UPI0038F71576
MLDFCRLGVVQSCVGTWGDSASASTPQRSGWATRLPVLSFHESTGHHYRRAIGKKLGLAHFDELAHLEDWAKTHSTHLAIFGGFMRYVRVLDFQVALRLYHEVSVIPADAQCFEYINCHPGSGLLGS